MKLQVDITKPFGLVLEGGGAKGAYQIGVWKALAEAGVRIEAIAGTSVGALNGALICMGDVDNACKVWENISHAQVLDVDEARMEEIFAGRGNLVEILLEGTRMILGGGADITPLKDLIDRCVDEDKVRNSGIDFYVSTFSLTDRKELDVSVADMEPDRLQEYLLASALIVPLFRNEKIHGKWYMDGGMFNNVPLDSLVKRGYENILVVRIFGIGHEKDVDIPEGVTVQTIAPRVNLGYMLDFDGRKSARNIKIGYYDAKRWLYGLGGLIYYIDEEQDEEFYFRRLMDVPQAAKRELCEAFHLHGSSGSVMRGYAEHVLGAVADMLGLSAGWGYKLLYLAVLEATAKQLHISKYAVYTVEELEQRVQERLDAYDMPEELPVFVKLIGVRHD